MTYTSRGRSFTETIVAAVFGGFLTGFVLVLCIGNYYRAKRAMERQREKRILRQQQRHGGGGQTHHNGRNTRVGVAQPPHGDEDLLDSPGRSSYVMNPNLETQQLLLDTKHNNANSNDVVARQRRASPLGTVDDDLMLNEHPARSGSAGGEAQFMTV